MFRHSGKNRTFIHNLKLASLLSFVAGMVNVAGYFALHNLTTNVTGHFAFFTDAMVNRNYGQAINFSVFIIAFLSGAFVSNLLYEIMSRIRSSLITLIPILIETGLLVVVALVSTVQLTTHGGTYSCLLLFAMGMQNALVTKVSNAVVRTTHLTGLFTDLGIELSQLFFYTEKRQLKKLHLSIFLRITIIICFFSGGVAGGYGFGIFRQKVLLAAAVLLLIGLFYDYIKLHIYYLRRKYITLF